MCALTAVLWLLCHLRTWAQVEGIMKLWTAEPGKHRERGESGMREATQFFNRISVWASVGKSFSKEFTRSFLDLKRLVVCKYCQAEIKKQNNGFNDGAHFLVLRVGHAFPIPLKWLFFWHFVEKLFCASVNQDFNVEIRTDSAALHSLQLTPLTIRRRQVTA